MKKIHDRQTTEEPRVHNGTRQRASRLTVFLRVARSGLPFSLAILAIALLLRSASFLVLGLAATSYSILLCSLLAGQYVRLVMTPALRHNIVTVRQPNMLTWTALAHNLTSPVLLSIEPLLPPYVVQRHRRVGDDNVTIFFDATRKGIYSVGAVSVTLQDPLHIFRIQRTIVTELSLTVVPRAISLVAMHIALTAPIDGQRVRYAPNVDASQLNGTHPYDGEPMNRIHWKMTAHTGSLVVKDFAPSASQTAILLVDYTVGSDTDFALETLDDTLSTAAASILTHVHNRNLPFALAAIGSRIDWIGPGRDRTHLLMCLSAVARAQAVRTNDTAAVLNWLNRNMCVIPAQSQLIILAHEISEPGVVHLLRQREHFARITIVLFPEGTFLLPGEHRAPYYLRDTEQLHRLRSLQQVLRQNGIELTIIGLNDALTALSTS